MERKYYPPYIEGTLPAFFKDDKIVVPFAMNKTVGWNEIDGFAIKIKNIQNNQLIGTLTTLKEQNDEKKYEASFDTSSIIDKLEIGVSYKIQMCYISITNSM